MSGSSRHIFFFFPLMQILFLDMSLLGCQTSGNLGQIAIANGLTDFSVAASPTHQGLSKLLYMSYAMHVSTFICSICQTEL